MDLDLLLDTPPWEWPKDAGKTFRRILQDPRAKESDRLIAANLAGDLTVMNDNMADALLAVVRSADEPELLRAKAAISFGPVLELADTDGFDDPDDVPITESRFSGIQKSLQKLYPDTSTPKLVRRRVLEASVRAPMDWHKDAIEAAYSSGDREWVLTAVFAMQWVRGFDKQILEALKSTDPDIHRQAVIAAGEQEVDAAWSHVAEIVKDTGAPKPLLLAAIGAVGSIRPKEAGVTLMDLAESDDEEIAEAAEDAISMAQAMSEGDDDEEGEDEWVN